MKKFFISTLLGVALLFALGTSNLFAANIKETVTFNIEGPGGHSHNAYGRTNALHAAGRGLEIIISEKAKIDATGATYTVKNISGGNSVNSIASDAKVVIEIQAADKAKIDAAKDIIKKAIDKGVANENAFRDITPEVTMVGGVPAWIRVTVQ